MRRLQIILCGSSPALRLLGSTLRDHGHQLDGSAEFAELLIEDGSDVPLPPNLARCLHLGLRVSLEARGDGLPSVQWQCWTGSAQAQRLIICQAPGLQLDGNGQGLRTRVVECLVERMTLEVTRFARAPQHFAHWPACDAAALLDQQGLHALEPLAFLHRFNQPGHAPAQPPLLQQLHTSLLHHAQRPALQLAEGTLSYRELQQRAMAIKAALQPCLVPGTPSVIGVCLEKSADLYAALLAVLGSGATYLPMDPLHPALRLQAIAENAKACLLLHSGAAPFTANGMATLQLDKLPATEQAPLFTTLPDQQAAAVAIYTSGTTGQPKGVLLSHANLNHFQAWYRQHVDLQPGSRVLQFSTIGFDASLLDILPTFIAGAMLVVPTPDQRRDPDQLLTLINAHQVSHAFLPPALLSVLPAAAPLALQHLVTGGDVCEPAVLEAFAGRCQLHNIYGPTETTVLATTRRMRAGDNPRQLGRPIDGAQVLILDEQGQPVTDDTPGELYITGAGVGLGYLHNPALSAQRFVTLALPGGQSLAAYRTGDIGQWGGDGITLCGRRDNQVKIRGFRVEPEEIEHCLRASGFYGQVAVVVDPQRRLLAFVAQPRQAEGQALTRLQAHAEGHLADYMRPLHYCELSVLPATANGKVDRQALLRLPQAQTRERPRLTPANAAETKLLALWSELLELPAESLSTADSFFNLGGHSILLSQMLLHIRERFGTGISINRFIEQPTLKRLAELVSGVEDQVRQVSAQALSDAFRPLDLQPLPLDQLGDVHKVVVTGANSFLGVHIVEALLAWGVSEVACLVRAQPGHAADERFHQALVENRLEHLDLSRVRVHAADITQPQLGLSDELYAYIDEHYGALIHNAAVVNHVLDYEALAASNVEPVFHCLQLCEGRRKKIFNFISTLSASSVIDADGNVLEEPPADTPPIYIRNGYNLSKWVAERILQRAREMGVWANLYRPGNITFNSRTGVCQPHKNRLMLMLKGSLQLGQVPALSLNFDLMPVDFLARFLAFHCSRYQPRQAVFNLHNPEPLSWASYVASFREAGREFELVSIAQWQQQLGRVDSDNALFGVLGFYLDGFEEDIGDISRIDHGNARSGVRRMGERYPSKTPALLRKGCAYLKEIQFI
ncbi:non-ribosomal peptide synthetase [Pseudomonas sp.]|uniref:non-ribosomal peptide synthetase n=1 Tax=Pseudomonas sp. TaxID=306 RepID=UPI003CC56201